jgi:hypothetical protein
MEMSEVIDLFRKANKRYVWGESSYILIYDDGSGEVVSEDSDYMDSSGIFEFNSIDDLVKNLSKKLRE